MLVASSAAGASFYLLTASKEPKKDLAATFWLTNYGGPRQALPSLQSVLQGARENY